MYIANLAGNFIRTIELPHHIMSLDISDNNLMTMTVRQGGTLVWMAELNVFDNKKLTSIDFEPPPHPEWVYIMCAQHVCIGDRLIESRELAEEAKIKKEAQQEAELLKSRGKPSIYSWR
jgi:hypothetical protein